MVPDSADLRAAGYSALAAFVDRHGDAVAAMLVASTPAERAAAVRVLEISETF